MSFGFELTINIDENTNPTILIDYRDGGILKKYSNKGYNKSMKIRYNLEDSEIMKSIINDDRFLNVNRHHVNGGIKEDTENVNKYDFDKIMVYNNTICKYEKCGFFTISYKDNNGLGEKISNWIYTQMKEKIYDKTTIDKKTYSISSYYERDENILKYKNCKIMFGDNGMDIKYKINILSLGRYTDNLGSTHKLLCKLKISHYLFCENFEYENYNNWINRDYCVLINCGTDYSIELNDGGQHIRNYILDYWKKQGEKFIWMLDDNIQFYSRLLYGVKIKIESKEIFTSVEHYVKHFDNVGVCSHNISCNITAGGIRNCLLVNEKCFTSLLINLETDIRFRFKYNEDHIFTIDNINKGYNSLCFNHIIYNKKTSGTEKGGNSKIYDSGSDCSGYNRKCNDTMNLLKNDIENGIVELKNQKRTLFKVTTKIKGKQKNIINHLQIQYSMLKNYNNPLNKIMELEPFNSNLDL